MLKKIAILATIVAMSTPIFVTAGESGQGRHNPEERLERMQNHLDLSDEQVLQIREIHENGGGREEIGAVLTEEQRTKMAKGKRKGAEKRLKHMQEKLDLSEEQVSQIREIRSNGGSREDVAKVLTEEQLSLVKEHRKNKEPWRKSGKSSTSNASDA